MDAWQSAKNTALRRAFDARKRLAIARDLPVNVFDACASIGIEVRFVDCKSLEGMYVRSPRTAIFLPSTKHRPPGRIAFSCAHELGHHELGHGTRTDEYLEGNAKPDLTPEELGADVFGAHFLMPRQAVVSATRVRGWDASELSPEQAFILSGLFGVGYETFVWQLSAGLQLMPRQYADKLFKCKPKSIRESLFPDSGDVGLVVLDAHWNSFPLDLEQGDFVIANANISLDSPLLELQGENDGNQIWRASTVGSAGLGSGNLIRVSKREYFGSWKFRYLADEE